MLRSVCMQTNKGLRGSPPSHRVTPSFPPPPPLWLLAWHDSSESYVVVRARSAVRTVLVLTKNLFFQFFWVCKFLGVFFWLIFFWLTWSHVKKKGPPNYCVNFYYRSLGATVVPTEKGPAFFRLFFEVLKAFQLWQTDGQTDTLKGCRLSNLPVERINVIWGRALTSRHISANLRACEDGRVFSQ